MQPINVLKYTRGQLNIEQNPSHIYKICLVSYKISACQGYASFVMKIHVLNKISAYWKDNTVYLLSSRLSLK